MNGLKRTIKVRKLAEVLDGQMLETKRALGNCEKKMRENIATLNNTNQYIDVDDTRKVNPAYQDLLNERAGIEEEIKAVREKRSMVEEALKRYDLLEGSREGKKYLEDAEVEVSFSQMVRWGISEDEVE